MRSDSFTIGLHWDMGAPQVAIWWHLHFDLNACSVTYLYMARKTGSHADITGPRIRKAALQLFAQSGYAAVSMRKIASEVGLQAGALYLYTPDKQALLYELMAEHMTDLLAAWDDFDPVAIPLSRLEAFVRFHISFNVSRPEAVFISYMELRNLSPGNFDKITALRNKYESILTGILEDGLKADQFDIPDTKLAALAIIAMLTGVNTWFRSDGRLNQTQIEQIYWDMVRRSVTAP